MIRSRLVARDFKGNDTDRNDLFAGTPPLEAKRMLFSRMATSTKGVGLGNYYLLMRERHIYTLCVPKMFILNFRRNVAVRKGCVVNYIFGCMGLGRRLRPGKVCIRVYWNKTVSLEVHRVV